MPRQLGLTVPALVEGISPRGSYVVFVAVTLACVALMYAMLRFAARHLHARNSRR